MQVTALRRDDLSGMGVGQRGYLAPEPPSGVYSFWLSPGNGETMKVKNLMFTVALCLAGAALSFAQSPQMGTWKLNEAKSKIPAGAPKNTTVVYEAAGDNVKVTTDGTGRDGQPAHTEWTGKFDGKDYQLTGDSSADSRSYKMINDHTLELANKMGGKVVATGRIVVSADGKTRTIHLSTMDSAGKKISGIGVYDKQ